MTIMKIHTYLSKPDCDKIKQLQEEKEYLRREIFELAFDDFKNKLKNIKEYSLKHKEIDRINYNGFSLRLKKEMINELNELSVKFNTKRAYLVREVLVEFMRG